MAEGEVAGWRPGVLASLARFWVISLALIVVFAIVGFAAASTQVAKATASASLVLANPSDSSLNSDTGATYVNDQVAILKLPSTVASAAALLAKRMPGAQLDRQAFESELSVSSGTNSQLVTVSVTDTDPDVAQAATAALVDTYTQVATKLANDTRAAQIATIQANIAAINANVRVSAPVAVQQQQQIQLYQQQIAQLSANGTTAASLIAASSPATRPTAKKSIPPALGLIAGLLIGVAAAIALSRILAQARQRFGGRFEPELIFSTPLLADVPSFSAERLPSDLPSVDSSTSSVTEAYRFATTALTSRDVTVVAVVSGASGEGKSSCTANLAVTAAYQGSRVVVVDADFEGKGVSFLLGQDRDRRPGLLDVLDGTVEFEDVIVPLDIAENLSLLTGGHAAGYDWPDVLSTSRWPQLVARLAAAYDLVIIDLPPYLQIAYAVPIVRATDGVVVVIPHKSPVSRAAELAERLRFVGVEALGYLYVKAPLRRELGLVSRLATDEDRRPVKRGVTTHRELPPSAATTAAPQVPSVATSNVKPAVAPAPVDAPAPAAAPAVPEPAATLEPTAPPPPVDSKRRELFFESVRFVVAKPSPTSIDVRADVLPSADVAAEPPADDEPEDDGAAVDQVERRLVRISLMPAAPEPAAPEPTPPTPSAADPVPGPAGLPGSDTRRTRRRTGAFVTSAGSNGTPGNAAAAEDLTTSGESAAEAPKTTVAVAPGRPGAPSRHPGGDRQSRSKR